MADDVMRAHVADMQRWYQAERAAELIMHKARVEGWKQKEALAHQQQEEIHCKVTSPADFAAKELEPGQMKGACVRTSTRPQLVRRPAQRKPQIEDDILRDIPYYLPRESQYPMPPVRPLHRSHAATSCEGFLWAEPIYLFISHLPFPVLVYSLGASRQETSLSYYGRSMFDNA
ncbi:hypothetical protein H0H92_014229 [Tricholoma furcatifolium]|nr:hypothetical protein H0H92_014229 [Tricholoma furcatifolium]